MHFVLMILCCQRLVQILLVVLWNISNFVMLLSATSLTDLVDILIQIVFSNMCDCLCLCFCPSLKCANNYVLIKMVCCKVSTFMVPFNLKAKVNYSAKN
jgi:hypothetical protein